MALQSGRVQAHCNEVVLSMNCCHHTGTSRRAASGESRPSSDPGTVLQKQMFDAETMQYC